MDSDGHPQITPEPDPVLGLTYGPEPDQRIVAAAPPPDEYEWYDPGFFARLTGNRPLIILLIIAFLILILGPSLFYVLNPPRPRPIKRLPGQGIPAMVPQPAIERIDRGAS